MAKINRTNKFYWFYLIAAYFIALTKLDFPDALAQKIEENINIFLSICYKKTP